jgi:Tfp pilus assembly protein PilV
MIAGMDSRCYGQGSVAGRGLGDRGGLSIIEAMVATAVISVVFLGASAYRYQSMVSANGAEREEVATEVGLLLLESWRGGGGESDYDPVNKFDGAVSIATGEGPAEPNGFTKLGSYAVTMDEVDCFTTLSWKTAATGLRELNAQVAWGNGEEVSFSNANRSVSLTTYYFDLNELLSQ